MTYIAIDLKSFYASVECMERELDPMTTNLVVADSSRTEKTICLAVSPSLKACGIPGRPRLFEVIQRVKAINAERRRKAPGGEFSGSSSNAVDLAAKPELSLDYIVAPPQMSKYIEVSALIYNVYLKYVAPEDIHVYSIDEVFIDAGGYLKSFGLTARELAMTIILDVLKTSGITATAGIGPNLYLCKVAMDIEAKHTPADENGVRIAELDEMSYRRKLWAHRPLTDFWRVGSGYARKLEARGIYTMGDIARCSIGKPNEYYNEDLLYDMFGVNAELLIDHAWGWEPCTMRDIKEYRPENRSIGSGQVLHIPYSWGKARLVVHEMADMLALDLVDKKLVTDQITLTLGYDISNLKAPGIKANYKGAIVKDRYGRSIPKQAHGTVHLKQPGSSSRVIIKAALELFDRIVDRELFVRRINITANNVIAEDRVQKEPDCIQLDIFTDYEAEQERIDQEQAELRREKKVQETVLNIKKKYGKNAILKGINLQEGATAKNRNTQIGGHKA